MEIYEHNAVHGNPSPAPQKDKPHAVVWIAAALAAVAVILSVVALVFSCRKRVDAPSYARVFGQVRSSCVQVYGASVAGSGVVYKIDGGKTYILTNHHVVEEGAPVSVRFTQHGEKIAATVLGFDSYHDIALLEAEGDYGAKAVRPSDTPTVGMQVLAVGNNLGYGIAAFDGIVSQTDRMLQVDETGSSAKKVVPVYAVTSPVNGGMSGGGLFDMQGGIVGINAYQTVKADGREVDGMSFSVPYAIAEKIARQILKERSGGQINKLYVSADLYGDADKTVDLIFTAFSFSARFAPEGLKINGLLYDEANPPFEILGGLPQVNDIVCKIGALDVTPQTEYASVFAECLEYIHDSSLGTEPMQIVLRRGAQTVTVTYSFKLRKNY